MFKILFLLVIISLLISFPAQADTNICETENYNLSGYVHPQRGKVVVYTTDSNHEILPEDLVCAAIKQFWAHKDSFPKKLTILVVASDYLNAMIMQINLNTSTMLLATINIPNGENKVKTVWTLFPEPMQRFTEMVRNEELPIATKHKTKANYLVVSRKDLIHLAYGNVLKQRTLTITRPVPENDEKIQ